MFFLVLQVLYLISIFRGVDSSFRGRTLFHFEKGFYFTFHFRGQLQNTGLFYHPIHQITLLAKNLFYSQQRELRTGNGDRTNKDYYFLLMVAGRFVGKDCFLPYFPILFSKCAE